MIEIIFKGKRKDNREWIEGSLITSINRAWISSEKTDSQRLRSISNTDAIWRAIEIIPDTICRFTGRYDKNRKKIWENDIFQYTDETMVTQKDLIEYNETHASFVRLRNTEKLGLRYLWIDEATCNHGEVIGNIFDNPELLQEESDE